MSPPTAVVGIPRVLKRGGGPIATVIGNGPIAVGTGSAMTHGPGRVTTTDDGLMTRTMVGSGFQTSSGRRPGFIGATAGTKSGGRPVRQRGSPLQHLGSCSLTSIVFTNASGPQP